MTNSETYEHALARSLVAAPKAALTEAEIAERIVAQRERMKAHDRHFSGDYMSGPEQRLVSVALARQYGANISHAPHDHRDEYGDHDNSGTD